MFTFDFPPHPRRPSCTALSSFVFFLSYVANCDSQLLTGSDPVRELPFFFLSPSSVFLVSPPSEHVVSIENGFRSRLARLSRVFGTVPSIFSPLSRTFSRSRLAEVARRNSRAPRRRDTKFASSGLISPGKVAISSRCRSRRSLGSTLTFKGCSKLGEFQRLVSSLVFAMARSMTLDQASSSRSELTAEDWG